MGCGNKKATHRMTGDLIKGFFNSDGLKSLLLHY